MGRPKGIADAKTSAGAKAYSVLQENKYRQYKGSKHAITSPPERYYVLNKGSGARSRKRMVQ